MRTNTIGCQWLGSGQLVVGKPLHFCNADCVPERSYCEEHVFKVYQEGSQQRRRRATYQQVNIEYWEDMFEQAVRELDAEQV